jgi:hypothetical protein
MKLRPKGRSTPRLSVGQGRGRLLASVNPIVAVAIAGSRSDGFQSPIKAMFAFKFERI